MRKNLNRFLSWAMVIIMILGMLPTTAFAAEDEIISATDNLIAVTDESADTGAAIETEEDLIAALAAGGEIVVAKDMTLNEDITIPAGVTVTVNEGYTLRVLGTLTNNGTIKGAGRVAVSVMVYIVEEKAEYNVTSTKNGAVEGTAPECTVAYEISLDGGASWITDTTGGKAQAVLVKTDGAKTVYSSFQSAYTSAKTGEIVHVLKDVHVQSTNTKKNYGPLFSYYGLILEGNGHTIYTDLESSGASNEYATLKFSSYLAGTGPEVDPVLKNVTIDSQNNAKADLDFVSGDVTFTVTMYNVNLLGNCQYASFAMKSSSMIINKSNVEIFDCTIPSWDAGSAKAIDIYSGDYSLSLNNKCTVYGGTFTKDVTNYLAEGVVLVKDEDGKYVAQADPAYGMVAKVGDTYYETLQSALDAAAAGTGNVTVEILCDVDLSGVDWNTVTVSAPGYPEVTVNGNNKTITGLNDMLFAGTWAGGSGLIINDLTIKDSTIVNDENDEKGTVGVGAFIGYPQASATITLNNCHLVDSTVKGGHWTGGLIGMAGGYNGNDGPVFMNLTIKDCSVTGSTITGKGSAGGVIGHGSCAAWTNVTITGTTVSGNTITSTGSSTNKAGSVMGTIGAAGQATTAAGQTLTGGAFVSATVSDNTVTSGDTTITTIYGRQGTSTGVLTLTGGSYDSYPIEENVTYAAPSEGCVISETDGTYSVREETHLIIVVGPVATMSTTTVTVATMDEAIAYAQANPADNVTYQITGPVELTTGYSHGILDLGSNVTIEGVTDEAKLTIVGGGVPDIQGVTFRNLTIADEGDYLTTANEFMYQNFIDCTFENVTFEDGIRLSGTSVLADCTVNANTANEYAIWLDAGDFTMTGSKVTAGSEAYGVIKSDEVSTITLTGNTFEYLTAANKEALNVKGAAITAENNTFINCTEGVVPADKTNYGADGTTEITDAAIKENNTVVIYVAQIGETKYESLAEAFTAAQDGDEVKILMAGTYALSTSGKDITITGAVDGVVFDNIGAKNMGGANVTFNNVTFNYAKNSTYKGLQHAGNLVYNNCTINGQVFLYGTSETFNNCTFNTTDADNYNVWTYGAKAVEFNGCTFNCAGKSVLIYSESNALYNDVTVTDCDFIASASVDGKAAIEMDSSLTAGIKLTIDAATTTSGFGTGNVSGNSLWNNKKDNKTEANNDITVVVAGETVLAPVAFVAKIGDIGYVTIADAISAAKAGETVRILAGEYDAFSVNKAITVVGETDAEGNNLVTINGKLSVTGTGVTVKNLNVNNSSERALYVSGGDILIEGCSLTGVHGLRYCYANNGDVTLKDCVITGTTYGVHFDAGSGEGNVIIDGCTITGWTSFGSAIEGVTITNTTFCDGNYDVLRFYQNATISGSTFDPATTIDFGKNAVELEITDSTVSDGSALTDVIYLGDIVNMGVSVTIDSESVAVEASVISGEDTEYYLTLTEAFAAARDGDTVKLLSDIELTESLVLNTEGTITIDGNGQKISTAADFKDTQDAAIMLGSSEYGDADAANNNYTLKRVVFDGVNGTSVIRAQGVTLTMDGCQVKNCTSAKRHTVIRLDYTEAAIKNSTFDKNGQGMVVVHNYNVDSNGSKTKLAIDNCVFSNNDVQLNSAVVYYVDGTGCSITNTEFVGNNINSSVNAATVYLGFMEDCTVTGCLFKDNTVHTAKDTTRVAGAIFFGYEADISGNAFVGNKATNANGDKLGQDICTSTYYEGTIDLSGNYFNGTRPVENAAYLIQHQTGDGTFELDNYYTAYTLDAEGNVILDGLVYLPSADMTYSAYGFGTSGEGEKYRENVMIDLYGVNAYNSLVLELYSNGELIATVSRRASDRDDETALLFPVTGNAATTVNIVIAGRLAGSWDTDWIKNPSVACIPDTVKVYADGELVDIYTDAFEAEDRAAYTALSGVYKAASVTDKAGIVTYYATLAEAFAAAQSSETVKLMVDCTEGYVMVTPGATLDLNGFKLTCSGLAVFKGSHVIDSSADTTGLLIVPQDNLSLQADNKELPVWNENAGYVFVTPNTSAADRYQYFYAVTDNSFDLRFRPGFGYANEESVKDAYFKTNGGADNGLKMVLRLSWTNNDGNTIHHDVEFTDELFEKAYQDGQGFKVMVTGTGAFGEITVNAVIVSDTGVEFVGEDIIYTPAMADDAE